MSTDNLDNDLLGAIKEADYVKMLQLLEWGANPDAADMLGDTALIWAARAPMFADENDMNELTARRSFAVEAVRLLLEKGADIDKPNNLGRSAAFQAIMDKNMALLTVFTQHEASMLLEDTAGNSMIRYAELTNDDAVLECVQKTAKEQKQAAALRVEKAEAGKRRQQSLRSFVRTRKM
ncbi:MAG: ankyrin repeat domain-containing protein [Alphaproteobacteria bacterium]|nr:MAG: ankyrin repeat domain-containing protein [Alphaproteobacteria bacterium]